MELLLQHGDHSRNGQGFLQEVDGAQQLVQRAMVRLTVPKGKFVLNPQLGSLLHTLGRSWHWNMPRRRCWKCRRCGSLQPGAGKAHRRMSCWCSLSWNVPLRTVSWSGRSWSGG